MATLEESISGLRDALAHPLTDVRWGWRVRQRLSHVRESLLNEPPTATEAWLSSRAGCLMRRRQRLLDQITGLGPILLEHNPTDQLMASLHRLVGDLEHHRQHVSDLVYDGVAMELGGSE